MLLESRQWNPASLRMCCLDPQNVFAVGIRRLSCAVETCGGATRILGRLVHVHRRRQVGAPHPGAGTCCPAGSYPDTMCNLALRPVPDSAGRDRTQRDSNNDERRDSMAERTAPAALFSLGLSGVVSAGGAAHWARMKPQLNGGAKLL